MRDKDRLIRAFGKLNMRVTDGVEKSHVSLVRDGKSLPSRHAVVLLCGSDISLTNAFEGLRELADENYKFTAVLSRSAEKLLCEKDIMSGFSPAQILKESEGVSIKGTIDMMDALIIPNLTQNTLAKVAVGIQDELTALITWQALVLGKPLVINTDSIFSGWFDINNNRAMKRVMQNHVAVLKGYGAKLADKHKYLDHLGDQNKRSSYQSRNGVHIGTKSEAKSGAQKPVHNHLKARENRHQNQSLGLSDIADKNLLTERDIKALEGVTEIKLGKGQILTPLGRDVAISRGIRIIYQRQ